MTKTLPLREFWALVPKPKRATRNGIPLHRVVKANGMEDKFFVTYGNGRNPALLFSGDMEIEIEDQNDD